MKLSQLRTWIFLSILALYGCKDNAMTNHSNVKFLVLDAIQPCISKVIVDDIERQVFNNWVDVTYNLTVVKNTNCLSESEKLIFSFTEAVSKKPAKNKMLYCEFIEIENEKGARSTIGAGSLFETHSEAEKHLSISRQLRHESEELGKSTKTAFDKTKFSKE